jgi:hypothetical protein
MKKIHYILFATSLLLFSCNNDDDNAIWEDDLSNPPAQAVLALPANNVDCIQGNEVTATTSTVTFTWNPAQNAGYYRLTVKNLVTQVSTTYTTVETTYAATLDVNTPYSWQIVTGRDGSSARAQSEVWKFYNAGAGVTTHIPFPAEAVAPQMGSHQYGVTTVNLQWAGSDLDNDIDHYEVYFGTDTNPTTLLNTVTATSINDVAVTANTTYYWKVATFDAEGNVSWSEIFQFKVD